jgi:hypothetical protein
MYTSGTTGRPKGCQHSTGGYLSYVAGTSKYYQDIHPQDTYWCAADIGWISGHSYIVYGSLALGTTSVMYEGVPTYPDAGRVWRIAEQLGFNIFHTAPTNIRMLRKVGPDEPARYDYHLKHMTTVGEPIEPEVWRWYYEVAGKREAAIVDTWWQTENGGFIGSTLPALQPYRPAITTSGWSMGPSTPPTKASSVALCLTFYRVPSSVAHCRVARLGARCAPRSIGCVTATATGGGPVRISVGRLSDPGRGVRSRGERRPEEAAGTRSHEMRPLRYSINVTLDGCCDHRAIPSDEDVHRSAAEDLAQADGLLFGRVIYEMMEAAWRPPAATGARPDWMEPFAQAINAAKKYVVSGTPGAGRLERGTRARGTGHGRSATQAGVGQGTVGGVKLPLALTESWD